MCIGLVVGIFALTILNSKDTNIGDRTISGTKIRVIAVMLLIMAAASFAAQILRIAGAARDEPSLTMLGDLSSTLCIVAFAGSVASVIAALIFSRKAVTASTNETENPDNNK